MQHPSGDWWLAYNGEAYNHRQLRSELSRDDHQAGGSDTETVLEAHARWGDAAVERLNGLFAYAARPPPRPAAPGPRPLRVKPLYVARHDGGLWFASESEALLAAGLPRRARPELLAEAVERGWANGPATPLAGIDRVRPGTALSVDLDTLDADERRWYDPAEAVDVERLEDLRSRPRAQLAKEVEGVLRAAVRRRLMADVPVGTMCSGGLDSGLVTAFAAEGIRESPSSTPRSSTSPTWTRRAGPTRGVPPWRGPPHGPTTAEDWRSGLVEAVRHNGYPLNHASAVPVGRIAQAARDAGIKVLLVGEGATSYSAATRGTIFRSVAGSRRGAARPPHCCGAGGPRSRPPTRSPWTRSSCAGAKRTPCRSVGGPGCRQRSSDLSLYLPHLLNRDDRMTMMRSVEARMPFLDPELAGLALNLPLEARLKPGLKGCCVTSAAPASRPASQTARRSGSCSMRPRCYGGGCAPSSWSGGCSARSWVSMRRTGGGLSDPSLAAWTAEMWCRLNLDAQPVEAVEEALWGDRDGDQKSPSAKRRRGLGTGTRTAASQPGCQRHSSSRS